MREYTEGGRSPFAEWFDGLDVVTAARVQRYIRRLEAGNFGAGYRVYYGREGRTIIILLGGGSKRRQEADIAAAVARWKRYKQTHN